MAAMTDQAPRRKLPTFFQTVLQWIEYHHHDECLKTDLGRALAGYFYALALQADRKQQDYGSENLTSFGPKGVMIRMIDKATRIKNLYMGGKRPTVQETVLETWGDWMVYEGIGWLMEAGLWPRGIGALPNEPILEQPRASDDTAALKAGVGLLEESYRMAQRMQAQYGGNGDLPKPGHRYKSNRVSSMLVECITVIPSFHLGGSAPINVLFKYLSEPSTVPVGEPHLSCEPLAWFMEKFPDEETR